AIAICALILPGISGSYMLVMLGEYKLILTALHERELPTVLVFMSGMAVGILVFIRFLKWLLHHYRSLTMAALAGIMLGSLRTIWPLNYVEDMSPMLWGQSVLFILLGLGLVIGLEKWGELTKSSAA